MPQSLLELAYSLYYPDAEFKLGKKTFNKVKTKLKATGYRYMNAGERALSREPKPRKRRPKTPDEAFLLGVGKRLKTDAGRTLRRINPFRKKK